MTTISQPGANEADLQHALPAESDLKSWTAAPPGRSKKRKTAPSTAIEDPHIGATGQVKLGDPVNSGRLKSRLLNALTWSDDDIATGMELDSDRLKVQSALGYRTVRATAGAYQGTWYFEIKIDYLGKTGAVRVGWATRKAELQAPVGADVSGFSFRSIAGSKVHCGERHEYGESFEQGDSIGCIMHLPSGGRPFEESEDDLYRYKGKLYYRGTQGIDPEPKPLRGSFIAFTINGKYQGIAYRDIPEGTYYPAVSLYTGQEQRLDPVRVTAHFTEESCMHFPSCVESDLIPNPASLFPALGRNRTLV